MKNKDTENMITEMVTALHAKTTEDNAVQMAQTLVITTLLVEFIAVLERIEDCLENEKQERSKDG
jgi:hypothetical protein